MKTDDIVTPADLENALRARALRRQTELWKVATGRSVRWTEVLGGSLAALVALAGFVQYFQDGGGTLQVAVGFALVASFLWSHTQRQIGALVEVVRRLDELQARRGDA